MDATPIILVAGKKPASEGPRLGAVGWVVDHLLLVVAVFGAVALFVSWKIAKKLSKIVIQLAIFVAALLAAIYFDVIHL